MGLFDWLKGTTSNVVVGDDVIWLSRKAKGVGVSSGIAASLAAKNKPAAILLVAHFQDCLTDLKAIAESGGFDAGKRHEHAIIEMQGLDDLSRCGRRSPMFLILASYRWLSSCFSVCERNLSSSIWSIISRTLSS